MNNQFSCVFSVDDKTSPHVQGPQQIVVEGEISLAVQVISNVPEESVLTVYINSLPLVVSSTIGLLADHTYIY